MSRPPLRVRASLACTALLLLAGCAGAPGPNSTAPDGGPDLFEALPPPTVPSVTPTTAPPAPPTPDKAEDDATGPRGGAARGSGAGGSKVNWQKIGGDEFSGSLNESAWGSYDSEGAFGTGERKPEAISQSGGLLNITAREDVSGGIGHEFGQTYGRWEFRARTDPGRGFGSAILLWPDSEKFPEDGELDIMEVPGENRDLAHFVIHWSEGGEDDNIVGHQRKGDYTQWHTFAIEWLPDRITWYVDGKKQFETRDKKIIPTKPMHLTIQLDQGPKKDWIPARDDTTPDEIRLQVDWVRIYKAPPGAR